MKNQEIARMFYEISEFLEMDNVPFKPYAYQKAVLSTRLAAQAIAVVKSTITAAGSIAARTSFP